MFFEDQKNEESQLIWRGGWRYSKYQKTSSKRSRKIVHWSIDRGRREIRSNVCQYLHLSDVLARLTNSVPNLFRGNGSLLLVQQGDAHEVLSEDLRVQWNSSYVIYADDEVRHFHSLYSWNHSALLGKRHSLWWGFPRAAPWLQVWLWRLRQIIILVSATHHNLLYLSYSYSCLLLSGPVRLFLLG